VIPQIRNILGHLFQQNLLADKTGTVIDPSATMAILPALIGRALFSVFNADDKVAPAPDHERYVLPRLSSKLSC